MKKEPKIYKHICEICHKDFTSNHPIGCVCSKKCSKIRIKLKRKETFKKWYSIPKNKKKKNASSREWWRANKTSSLTSKK